MSGSRTEEPIARQSSGSITEIYFCSSVVRQTGVVTRQTGTVRNIQVCGCEAGVGQSWADEGVVPDSRQSRGQGADVGRSRADARQRRGSKTDVDSSRRGYWDKTETGADVDAGTGTETEKAWKLRVWNA